MRRSHHHSSATGEHYLLHKYACGPEQEHVAATGYLMHTSAMIAPHGVVLRDQLMDALLSACTSDAQHCNGLFRVAARVQLIGLVRPQLHQATSPHTKQHPVLARCQEPLSGAASFAIHSLSAAAQMSRSVLLKLNWLASSSATSSAVSASGSYTKSMVRDATSGGTCM